MLRQEKIKDNGPGRSPADWFKKDGAKDFCTMEMRLKIVEANAEHDFAFKGSSECIVRCLCTTFFKPVRRTPARAVIFYFP